MNWISRIPQKCRSLKLLSWWSSTPPPPLRLGPCKFRCQVLLLDPVSYRRPVLFKSRSDIDFLRSAFSVPDSNCITAALVKSGVWSSFLQSRKRYLFLPFTPPSSQLRHLPSSFSYLVFIDGNHRLGHAPPIACFVFFREDDASSSENERTGLLPHTVVGSANTSHCSPSLDGCSQKEATYKTSLKTVALCVSSAGVFGIGIGLKDGLGKASEFFAAYLLEQSLSVDNLFVFVLIFKYFKVPPVYQNRVLSYGIPGAIIFRLSVILLGTATLARYEALNLLLASILLYSSFKLFRSEEDDTDLSDNGIVKTCRRFIPITSSYDGNRFFTKRGGIWKATPLLLTVAVIELSDIAFAVDSIPAVFGVTRDPFIVFSSNLFAIIGLRSLYTLISGGMEEMEYLQASIAVVLGFMGGKMILDFFGFGIPTEASLGVVVMSLGVGVLLSLANKSKSSNRTADATLKRTISAFSSSRNK